MNSTFQNYLYLWNVLQLHHNNNQHVFFCISTSFFHLFSFPLFLQNMYFSVKNGWIENSTYCCWLIFSLDLGLSSGFMCRGFVLLEGEPLTTVICTVCQVFYQHCPVVGSPHSMTLQPPVPPYVCSAWWENLAWRLRCSIWSYIFLPLFPINRLPIKHIQIYGYNVTKYEICRNTNLTYCFLDWRIFILSSWFTTDY